LRSYKAVEFFNFDEVRSITAAGYYMPPGVVSQHGDGLRASHGRVHFAGSERAIHGNGWMEGAIRRGNEVSSIVAHEFDPNVSVEKELQHWDDEAVKAVDHELGDPIKE